MLRSRLDGSRHLHRVVAGLARDRLELGLREPLVPIAGLLLVHLHALLHYLDAGIEIGNTLHFGCGFIARAIIDDDNFDITAILRV